MRFLHNRDLLRITGKPAWFTIKEGRYEPFPFFQASTGLKTFICVCSSHQYVNAILEKLPEGQLHLSTPVASVGNTPDGITGMVQITTADGRMLDFDRVIMACHSDTTLALLKAGRGTTDVEEQILGRFTWNRNEVVLHHDANVSDTTHVVTRGLHH